MSASGSRSIEIARTIRCHSSVGICTVTAAGEVVQHGERLCLRW
jgi:hypothetical protein